MWCRTLILVLSIIFTSKVIANEPEWALVRVSVACLRSEPKHSSELVSQAIMGTPLRLLEKNGQWWKVESPDGYTAYIIGNSVVERSSAEMDKWKSAPRLVITTRGEVKTYDALGYPVSDLVNASIVEGCNDGTNPMKITLPDGRCGYIDSLCVAPLDKWGENAFNPTKLIGMGASMMGTPYLWGGMSSKSLDCSGFVRVCYMDNGIILRRDASQQALIGRRIEPEQWRSCQRGDLLFFGNAATGRVTHVAIYDHDGEYLHSSGMVRRNSLDSQSPLYLPITFLHAVRIAGYEGTDGITRVINHPWYFNLTNHE